MASKTIIICDECGGETVGYEVPSGRERGTVTNASWLTVNLPGVVQHGHVLLHDKSDWQFCSPDCARRWLHKRVDGLFDDLVVVEGRLVQRPRPAQP